MGERPTAHWIGCYSNSLSSGDDQAEGALGRSSHCRHAAITHQFAVPLVIPVGILDS